MRKITFTLLTKLPAKYISSGLIIIIVLFIYGVVGSIFIMNLKMPFTIQLLPWQP